MGIVPHKGWDTLVDEVTESESSQIPGSDFTGKATIEVFAEVEKDKSVNKLVWAENHESDCKEVDDKQPDSSVDHPAYYQGSSPEFEVIEVIEVYGMSFSLGCAYKYVLRAGKKESKVTDLKKALWYVNRILSKPITIEDYGNRKSIFESAPSAYDIAKSFSLDFFTGSVIEKLIEFAVTMDKTWLTRAKDTLEYMLDKEQG